MKGKRVNDVNDIYYRIEISIIKRIVKFTDGEINNKVYMYVKQKLERENNHFFKLKIVK